MLKDATYREKFSTLNVWMPTIVQAIKKELKNENLKNPAFARQYFPGKNVSKLNENDFAEAYQNAIANPEYGEEIAENIANCWLMKHSDTYHFFEEELSKINPNFDQIQTLELAQAQSLINRSIVEFGAPNTYLFCVLNSVALPQETYEHLGRQAEIDAKTNEEQEGIRLQAESLASLQRSYEQNMARLTDKYEKKLAGMQKKYTTDVESLKKQISSLQRKLAQGTS